jgi:hypothetical protein
MELREKPETHTIPKRWIIMAVKKAANYDDATLATMREMYTGENNKQEVSAIAAKIGKPVASIRAKLAQMGVYQKEEKAATTSTRVKKVDIVSAIVKAGVPLNDAEAEGLEKSTASALQKVLARLTN